MKMPWQLLPVSCFRPRAGREARLVEELLEREEAWQGAERGPGQEKGPEGASCREWGTWAT